jgi:hypothetical protein
MFAAGKRRALRRRKRKHADSLAPRVAHGIGRTAEALREDRNG